MSDPTRPRVPAAPRRPDAPTGRKPFAVPPPSAAAAPARAARGGARPSVISPLTRPPEEHTDPAPTAKAAVSTASKTQTALSGLKNAALSKTTGGKSGAKPTPGGIASNLIDRATAAKDDDSKAKVAGKKAAAAGAHAAKAVVEIGRGAAAGGGVPGAVAAAALIIARNRKVRVGVITLALVIAMIVGLIGAMTSVAVISATSALAGSNQRASLGSVEDAGVDESVFSKDFLLGTDSGIPWTLITSWRRVMREELDVPALVRALDEIDPSQQSRSLDTGGVYQQDSAARVIPDQNQALTDAAAAVKETYVTALTTLPKASKPKATQVYDLALRWWLGQQASCGVSEAAAIETLTVKGAAIQPDQVEIAKVVIGIAKSALRDAPAPDMIRAAEIAMSTAIVESTLHNYLEEVDHTSLGVFQQQDWWGTPEQRTEPAWATARFLKALFAVPAWNTMDPGVAAQSVQVSAHPERYTESMPEAEAIVRTLWGDSIALPIPEGLDLGENASEDGEPVVCLHGYGMWVSPLAGEPKVTSWWGPRISPITGEPSNHNGMDFNSDEGIPIYAVSGGEVSAKGSAGACGFWISLRHDDDVTTRYCHMVVASSLNVGDTISAGDQVGMVGNTGDSTGNHLHFAIYVKGKMVDPVLFMLEHGVDFTTLPYRADIGPWGT